MAAEIVRCNHCATGATRGFNEAAANGRGNRRPVKPPMISILSASMRPRRMAAEIVRRGAPESG